MSNYTKFAGYQASLSPGNAYDFAYGRAIYKFGGDLTANVPIFGRTGQMSLGNPTERKKFHRIEFHGRGTLAVRVYIDGVAIADKIVTLTEASNRIRAVNLPRGTKGYTIDIEFAGDAEIRAIEIGYDSMSSTS